MVKKLMKTLLTTATCATLVVCGTAVTAHAANNPDLCAHDGYYIVEDSGGTYEDNPKDDNHIFHYWEEILCMECFGYDIKTGERPEGHVYNGDNICDYCGHDNIAN